MHYNQDTFWYNSGRYHPYQYNNRGGYDTHQPVYQYGHVQYEGFTNVANYAGFDYDGSLQNEIFQRNQGYQFTNYSSAYHGNQQALATRNQWGAPYEQNYLPNNRPSRKTFRCYDCQHVLPNYRELRKHRDERHKRNFYCGICHHQTSTYAALKIHKATHTIQACTKCPEVFKFKDSLEAHIQHAHSAVQLAITSGEAATDTPNAGPTSQAAITDGHEEAEVKCAPQPTENSHSHSFAEPSATSTPTAEKENKSSTSYDSGVKMETFHCPHCIKSFESEHQMYSHAKIHSDTDTDLSDKQIETKAVATLSCPFCIKKFISRRDLTLHMSSVHTQVFYCPKCPEEFNSPKLLGAHQEEVHKCGDH